MGLNIDKIGPNRYFLDVRVRRLDDDGEDRRRETVEGDYQAAAARYLELRKEIKERQALRCRFETFGDLLRWYAEKRPPTSKDQSILDILDRSLGAVSLPAFPDRFEAHRFHLQRDPSPKTGRPLANGSVNRYTALVRAAFQLACDWNPPLLEKNPITKTRFPKLEEKPRDVMVAPPGRLTLFNVIQVHRPWIEAVVRFEMAVPSRKSELSRLPIDHLDLVNMLLRIVDTKSGMGVWKPIPPDQWAYFRSIPAGCRWVFFRPLPGKRPQEWPPVGDYKKAWATCRRLAGLEGLRIHDTRHMSATDLLNNGTPPRAVMDIAGWKTDMMRIYFHRDTAASAALARFSPEGVRTLAAYTQEESADREAVG